MDAFLAVAFAAAGDHIIIRDVLHVFLRVVATLLDVVVVAGDDFGRAVTPLL